MAEPTTVSPVDLRLLVVSAALEPVLTLARISGLHLDDLQSLVSMGYFREYQRRGVSLRGMRHRLGKSLRTLARLSKQVGQLGKDGEQGLPLAGSERIGWRRQIVAMLMAGPKGREEIEAALPAVGQAGMEEALNALEELGVITLEDERYAVASDQLMLVREDLDHRLDSVRHFLSSVAQVLYRRFLHTDPDAEAFARVLSFSVEKTRLRDVRERIYEVLHEEVFAADADADASTDESVVQASVVLAFVETPSSRAWRARQP